MENKEGFKEGMYKPTRILRTTDENAEHSLWVSLCSVLCFLRHILINLH